MCDEGTELVVLGAVNDVEVYRKLTQQGISDYLVAPYDAQRIFDAIAAVCIDPSAPPRGRVLSFTGARGGTGSSTVAANTAWSLARIFDDDVAVLDLDLAFGTQGLAFNTEHPQGIQDALAQPDRLDEVLLKRFMAQPDNHVMLLTAPGALDRDADIDVQSLDVLVDLVRQTAPFVVLDVPHRWSSWSRHALAQSDEIVLTSTLDLACLRDTKSIFDVLSEKRANDAPVRIVLNHLGAYRKTQLSVKDFEDTLGSAPTLVVPHDPVLFGTAANNGQMIGDLSKNNKVADGFRGLAQSISGQEPPKTGKQKKGGLSLLSKGKGK